MTIQCSFCGKDESPYRKMVAGPSVFICSECILLAKDAIASQEMGGKVFCSGCRDVAPADQYLAFAGGGYLCGACARAVRAATDHL